MVPRLDKEGPGVVVQTMKNINTFLCALAALRGANYTGQKLTRNPHHFFVGRYPFKHLLNGALPHRKDTILFCSLLNCSEA